MLTSGKLGINSCITVLLCELIQGTVLGHYANTLNLYRTHLLIIIATIIMKSNAEFARVSFNLMVCNLIYH